MTCTMDTRDIVRFCRERAESYGALTAIALDAAADRLEALGSASRQSATFLAPNVKLPASALPLICLHADQHLKQENAK